MDWFTRVRKLIVLTILILIYLIYTNQSSTLWYSLRRSLKDVERAQDTLDDLELNVGQTEQRLWSSVERVSNKNKVKKVIIN